MATKSPPNYWKAGVIAGAVIALFLLGRSCGINSVLKTAGSDTVIYRDSTRLIYQPIPYKVVETIQGKTVTRFVHDTTPGVYEVRVDPADTAAIFARFYDVAYYDQSYHFRDDTLRLRDTVTQNRITGRGFTWNTSDTMIKETVTLRPPRRIVGYWTLSAGGNTATPLGMAGLGLGVKLPSDMVIQVEGKLVNKHRPMIEVRAMWPVRLGRRK